MAYPTSYYVIGGSSGCEVPYEIYTAILPDLQMMPHLLGIVARETQIHIIIVVDFGMEDCRWRMVCYCGARWNYGDWNLEAP